MQGMPSAAKRTIRTTLRGRRRLLWAARESAADAAALARHGRAVVRAGGLGPGSTTTLYESFDGEPPTADLLSALLADGLRVLLPITESDLDLDWFDAADPHRRPLGKDAIHAADLVLAPGLAVDITGTRMGQGGGCYDRALPRRAPGVAVVVLLHPGELHEALLPQDAHDVAVDGVLTADGVTWLAPYLTGSPKPGPESAR